MKDSKTAARKTVNVVGKLITALYVYVILLSRVV